MSKREELRKLAEGKDKIAEFLDEYPRAVYERLVAEGILTEEEIEQVKVKHCAMLDQTVPFGNGARLKPLNRTPNHAVGECYKATGQYKAGEFIDLRQTLNIHDPDNQYVWADEGEGWVIWAGRALGVLGLFTGIYCLVLLGLLL